METLSESITKLSASMEAPTLSSLLTRKIINYNHSGRMGQKIKYLIVHDTGNARSGASASAHQKYFGSGIKKDQVLRHYDASGKICPRTMSDDNWSKWKEFKEGI